MLTYAATVLAIVFSDLLTGVLIGFGLTLGKLAWKASRLVGAATFLKVPALTRVRAAIPAGAKVQVPLNNLSYIDHVCLE